MNSPMIYYCKRQRRNRGLLRLLNAATHTLAMPISGIAALLVLWLWVSFLFACGI